MLVLRCEYSKVIKIRHSKLIKKNTCRLPKCKHKNYLTNGLIYGININYNKKSSNIYHYMSHSIVKYLEVNKCTNAIIL